MRSRTVRGVLDAELEHRLDEVIVLAAARHRSVADARAHVEAVLGYEVYCHHVLQALLAPAHGDAGHRHG